MSEFFIGRPIVAIVIAIVTVLIGVVAMPACRSRSSRDHSAADQRDGDIHRRRRAHDRAVGRDAARAADERRRRHALHAVDQRERRHDEPDRHVRRRHRSRHRQRARQEPLSRRRSRSCPPDVKNFGVTMQEVARVPAAGRLAVLARRPLRRDVSRQLRATSTSTTRCCACRASATSATSAPATTRCASGSSPIGSRGSALTVPDVQNAVRQQNVVNPAGQIGGGAGAARAGDHVHGARAGPARRRPRSSATSSSARIPDGSVVRLQDVAPHRARRAELPAVRPLQRPAGGGRRRVPDARARTRSRSPTNIKATMEELAKRFPPDIDYRSRSTRRCRSPRASARSCTRSSRPSCSSSSSCSSSCRTGARR